ncbi:MAG: 50S ribosomal protein L13 [Candidatus Krumholzibacteriota bacterium]|nr:50S ribosomal protein L13 [Candidatus Krumholzibacteriota bacterium]
MQKTTVLKPGEFERNWYLIDANGKTLGRLASRIATILRGKNKPGYAPHMDIGDFIVVVNASKVKVTGNKLEDKNYWSYSGYSGGLRLTSLKVKMEKDPVFPLTNAVKGMLPHNKLGRRLLKKLKVYAGAQHPHKAQAPEVLEF